MGRRCNELTLLNNVNVLPNVFGRLRTKEMEEKRVGRDKLVKNFNHLKVFFNFFKTSVISPLQARTNGSCKKKKSKILISAS